MPRRTVLETGIEHISILDEHGNFDEELGADLIEDGDVVSLYRHMALCRHFDEIAFKLQRSGRMGTYPENRGQEAAPLGAAFALRSDDWLVTCYRENAGLFWRGMSLESILLHWMGDERGNVIPRELHCTPIAIAIGSQLLHATGLAWAAKYRGEDSIACTFFGDGATSEGDFHEAANFAANLKIPVLFVCQNNGWAISTPTSVECAAPTLAQRGIAYGMRSIQVDGNDIFAVVKVIRDAAEHARDTSEPVFIEAVTYRLGDHTTADDARRYRDEEEVAMWEARDPIIRTRGWLESRGLWDDTKETALAAEVKATVSAAVKRAEEIDAPGVTEIFDWIHADMSPELALQRRTLRTSSLGQDSSQADAAIEARQES